MLPKENISKCNDYFFATTITLVAIRTYIFLSRYFVPEKHLVIYGYLIHHFWLGYPLIITAPFIKQDRLRNTLAGIGTAPIADEFVFMMLGGGGYASYWQIWSVVGTIVCLIIIFVFREKIVIAFRN